MFTFGHKSTTAYKVNISINGTSIDMEIDTGASLSVISEATYAVSYSEGKVPPL
jgi:predicted aspartyl protease